MPFAFNALNGEFLMSRLKIVTRNSLLAAVAVTATAVTIPLASPARADASTSAAGALSKAQTHYNRGDYRAAMIELKNALRANPKNAQARVLQAQVYLRMQQGIAAQTEVEAARRAGVSKDNTRHLMAEAMVLQRRFNDALEETRAGTVPATHAAEAARVRGLAYLGLRQMDKAREELTKSDQLNPRNVQTKLDLSRYYGANRDRANAELNVDRALQLDPRNVKALVMKGDIVRATQGLEKALPLFSQALQIDPRSLEALLERAATYTDLRRDKEAMDDLKRVQALVPDHPLSFYLQAVMQTRARKFQEALALMGRTKGLLNNYPPAMLLQGVIAYETNNLQQAQTFLSKLLEVAPGHDLARRLYGATLLRNGDPDGALKALRPLLDRGAKDSRLLALVASAHARKGDFDESEKFLQQAVAAEPDQALLRTQLAMTRVAQGDTMSASRDLDAVLKEDPKSLQALMMSALVNMRSGDFKKGLAAAERLVKTYPDLAIGYNMRGAAYLGQSKYKEAEANFRTAIQKKPSYHEARRNLAQLLAAQGKYEEAKRELQRALEADSNNVKTLVALANLSGMQGKRKEKVDWLRKAVAAAPQTMGPRAQLVQAYMETGDTKSALTEASALDRDFSSDPRAVDVVGRAQAAAKQYTAAAGTFERLTRLMPDSVGARVLYARALSSDNRTDAARRAYVSALSIKGQDTSQVLLDLMALEARAGNFDKAVGYANQLKKEYPKKNVADATLGNLYMSAKQWAKAAQSYEAARARGFNKLVAINLSQAYVNMGQPAKGIAVLQDWLKRQPKDLGARIAISDIHMRNKQYKEALAQYTAMGPAASKNALVQNNIAWIYGEMGDKRAIPTAEAAARLAPDSPEIADTLGYMLVTKGGDVKRGLLLLQKAAEKMPNDPNVRYHLALAYRANGRPRDAARELEAILNKYKNFDSIVQARSVLQAIKTTGR